MNRDESTVCYTMRSYLMAREARDSDVTWPAGYSTCQKASRFESEGCGQASRTSVALIRDFKVGPDPAQSFRSQVSEIRSRPQL